MKKLLCFLLLSGSFCFSPTCFSELQPSLELLEFLGEWQDEDGEQVDPFDYSEGFDSQQPANQNHQDQHNDKQQTRDE